MNVLTPQALLGEILAMREEFVRARLLQPSETTEFGYGKFCGEYQGFERVIEYINGRLEQEAGREDNNEIG